MGSFVGGTQWKRWIEECGNGGVGINKSQNAATGGVGRVFINGI